MPYYVERNGNTWRLTWREFKQKPRSIAKLSDEARRAGFRPEMTLEEAKTREKQLRDEEWVKREAVKATKADAIVQRYKKLRNAFLTDADAEEFERDWLKDHKIRTPHWNTMQRIIVDVSIHPSEWFKKKARLYQQFKEKRCSANYAKKLLRYLNIWGYYLCDKQGRAFLKVPGLPGSWRNILEEARRPGGQSKPLSPAFLNEKKGDIPEEFYRWLYISVWFGLRPEEIDNLRAPQGNLWDLTADERWGWVLSIFQPKLFKRGVPRDDCWKHIPCYFPEQKRAVEFIQEQRFRRPVGAGGKFMRQVFGLGFSLYAGRNNFSGLLRDAGFDLETRKHWLGHLSVKTTEAYDRKTQRKRVFIRLPTKKQAA